MRCFAIFLLAIAIGSSGSAQQQPDSNQVNAGAAAPSDSSESSVPKMGKGDVINVSVYDSPELTRNVTIDADGNIRLPMVRQHIHAAGLIPDELEKAITAALVDEQVMVNPIVMVTVVENHSQAITVVGAVKNPTTFQAGGAVTLLEAIIRAGGISDVAGSDILVSHQTPSSNGSIAMTERIPVRSLMDPSDPASSLLLEGGEIIRVPLGGRIFIVGNVKHPGPLQIAEGSDNTVLKDITLAGGLDSFTSHTAYIYRVEAGTGRNDRIPIQIKKIMTFKAPDVPLYANDMVYVPNATGQRLSAKALEWSLGIGLGIAGILIYLVH